MIEGNDQINLRALRAFREVVRTGSVTVAAREMSISQPAVSRLLAQLEEQTGILLFIRDHGRLMPTQEGLLLYEEVELFLNSVQRVYSLIRDIASYQVGQLKIVAPPSFSESILPDIASAFIRRYPGVRLSIQSRSVESAKLMIATRDADAGFLQVPVERPDLNSSVVVRSSMMCVLAATHPLASMAVLTPNLIGDEPLIIVGKIGSARCKINASFAQCGVQPYVRIETHTIGSACALASKGLGIALVNGLFAESYVRPGSMMLPFEPKLVNEYAFVTSALSSPSRLTKEFFKHTQSHFGQ